MRLLIALFACGLWIPAALSDWSPPEDEDTSGDDLEISGSGSGDDGLPESHADVQKHLYITPFSTSLDPVPVSVTTEPNQSLRYEPEKAISSWAPLTIEAGSVITTDQATEALTDENHQHGQSTSDTSDATPTPADTQPRAGKGLHGMGRRPSLSSVTPITTMTVDVDATVVKQEPQGVPDSEKMHPAPSATPPSEAKVPNPTQGMPTSDSVASVSTLLTTVHDDSVVEEVIIPGVSMEVESEGDSDITLEEEPRLRLEDTANASSQNQSLLDRTEVLAGVIAGGVVGLAFAILLVSLMVYRMKKKDEGSYSLDEHKHPNVGYQKPQKQEEFLA